MNFIFIITTEIKKYLSITKSVVLGVFVNIIVISDIHGDVENLLTYLDKVRELKFDVIVCPGDFSDVNTPKGFTQEDIIRLIISELKSLKVPIVAVPGNVDPKNSIGFFEKNNMSVHGRGMVVGEFGFFGYGGAKTPFGTTIEPTEEELRLKIQNAYKDVRVAKFKILVTHNPPYNTKLDMIQTGIHVGSKTVRSFIEKHQPILSISAHIHEARGIDKLGDCSLINSGRFPEGYMGFVTIKDGVAHSKILNVTE